MKNRLTLKHRLQQMLHVADVLEDDHVAHLDTLNNMRSQISTAIEDIMEPEQDFYAENLIKKWTPVLDAIAQDEKCPDTEPSPYNHEDEAFILPPESS